MEAMDLYELVKQDENELEIFLEDHPELFRQIDKVNNYGAIILFADKPQVLEHPYSSSRHSTSLPTIP